MVNPVPLGGLIKWDYLRFDPEPDRFFISQGTELIVLDPKTGTVVGHVTGLTGSHGIAIDHANGVGYADSGKTALLIIFLSYLEQYPIILNRRFNMIG